MKPFNSGAIIAAWFLRIMLSWFIYRNYFQAFTRFDLDNFGYYVEAAYVIFALLLLVGGFLQKQTLTVISGLVIFILPIVQLIRMFPENLESSLLMYLIPLSVGFYFFTSGNNQ